MESGHSIFFDKNSTLKFKYIELDVRGCDVYLQEDEESFWGARPLSGEVLETALFNVMYLLLLRHRMQDAYNQPLRDIAKIYLSSLRDTHDRQYKEKNVSHHLLSLLTMIKSYCTNASLCPHSIRFSS